MKTIENLQQELTALITDKVNTENFMNNTLTINFKRLENTNEVRKQLTEIVNQLSTLIELKQTEIIKEL